MIQCTSPSATDISASATSGSNLGIYEWDSVASAWFLLESRFESFAETETLWAEDYYYPPATFSFGSGGGSGGDFQQKNLPPPRNGGRNIAPSCAEDPVELPTVLVTGPRPSSSFASFGFRMALFRAAGGNGSGIGRRSLNVVANDSSIDCSSIEEIRIAVAQKSLAQQFPFAKVGTIFTVRYSNGQSQTFRLNSKQLSLDVGPISACR